ncbi:MAG: A24 family peptidase C-terminal domain-containing protein [Candidatus Heimdallarchaeota archaeon]
MTFELAYSIIVPTLTLLALLFAGIEDVLYREVRHELVWILMVVFGLVLDILYILLGPLEVNDALLQILLSIVVGLVIGFALFYLGIWGGADTKALWALSILTPIYPFSYNILGLELPEILVIDGMIFSIIINSGLIAILYPIILLIVNAIKSSKTPLFRGVKVETSEKIRCFLFGYTKKVSKIKPNKLHYDFLEDLPDLKFTGKFEGDYKGRLDGKFTGVFHGELKGEFSGDMTGLFKPSTIEVIDEENIKGIIAQAKKLGNTKNKKSDDDEGEVFDAILDNYRKLYLNEKTEETSENQGDGFYLDHHGKISGPIKGYFIGTLEGVFEGEFNGKMVGDLTGDFSGTSTQGKISGTQEPKERDWKIKFRLSLDDEELMEKRQLRTLWQLEKEKKETVWVTPGLPFVTLMFFGYIMYLLFGNIALVIFAI